MMFHTWTFAAFLLVFMAGYLAVRKSERWRLVWLLVGSYVFYAWWDVRFLLPLWVTTLVDFYAGRGIARSRHPKFFLTLSLLVDLGILCTFKYLNFFTENLQYLCELCHWEVELPESDLLLPVGISFYTFQSLTYVLELYFRRRREEPSLLRYAAFVAMFPQILAGPIERASNLLPQLRHRPVIRRQDLADGVSLFLVGMFKKAVMADMLALYVDKVYRAPDDFAWWSVLLAAVSYSWQIYFDFSGYSDMARGVGRVLGLRLMLNFENPYTAVEVRDFWKRWHISLSSWFKDYVYIPLGGGRCVKFRVWMNVMITMVVSGFWHGAAWNFIIWGALNGIGSILSPRSDRSAWFGRIPKLLRQLATFAFITVTWVFFRTSSTGEAWHILRRICSGAGGTAAAPLIPLVMVCGIWLWQFCYESRGRRILECAPVRIAALAMMTALIMLLSGGANTQFIYFQF